MAARMPSPTSASNEVGDADESSLPTARFVPNGTARRSGFGSGEGVDARELLKTRVRLVCGEAWTGKTTFALAYSRWKPARYIEARTRVGGGSVLPPATTVAVLDGLDEALREEPTFAARVLREVEENSDLQLIITCRTMELPATFTADIGRAAGVSMDEVRLDLAPWTEAEAREAVDAVHPGAFNKVMSFARKMSLEPMMPFPRAVLALADLHARDLLSAIVDEPTAWRAVMESILTETNAAVRVTEATAGARLKAVARVAALMSMTGATEVKVHESAAKGGLYLAELVDGADVAAAREALGAVGVERAPGVWALEPANVRDWLVAFGLDSVEDDNLIAALTPLQGATLGIARALLRLRPNLAGKFQLLDRIEAEISDAVQHGMRLGADLLGDAPPAIGQELAKRIADPRRSSLVRASLLRMVTPKQAHDALPPALAIVMTAADEALRHEALRVVLHHGSDEDLLAVLRIRDSIADADRAWLLNEALGRKLVSPRALLWEVPDVAEVVDFRRLLVNSVAASLTRDDVLPILREVVQKKRWPSADALRERVLDLLEEGAPPTLAETEALIDVLGGVGRDGDYRLDRVLDRAGEGNDTRRYLFLRWLRGDGARSWSVLQQEDVEWLLAQDLSGPRAEEAISWGLVRCTPEQRARVEARAEELSPGAVARFAARRAAILADETEWRRKFDERQARRPHPKLPIEDAVKRILSREGDAASKLHDLAWTVISGQGREMRVKGTFADLPATVGAEVKDTLMAGITAITATPVPAWSEKQIPIRFLIEQDLLVWLLARTDVPADRWLTPRVVTQFLPGLLRRSFGRVGKVVEAMFVSHPAESLNAALDALRADFADPGTDMHAAYSLPGSAYDRVEVQALAADLVTQLPRGPQHIALLRVLRERHSGIAAIAANNWLTAGATEVERVAAFDALLVAAPREWIARLRAVSADDRRHLLEQSGVLSDIADRGSTLSSVTIDEAVDVVLWLEAIVPGPEVFRSGYLGEEDILQMWKSTAINRLWSPFLAGDADAERALDELSSTLPWLRASFVRDRTERTLRAAVGAISAPDTRKPK